MRYDRDLRWIRRIAWLFLCVNLVAAAMPASFRRHDWVITATALSWVANCLFWLRTLHAEQDRRDFLNRRMYTELHDYEDTIRKRSKGVDYE